MPSAHLSLKEEDVVKLALEFLNNRELHITQLSLERETGVINGVYSDDMLFLRQLILDGQWDDVLEFVQPLEGIDGFDSKQFSFIVHKHKYIELLCIKSEVGASSTVDVAVDEVVKCLNELETFAPSKDEYSALCLLLTLPRLIDHSEYRNWNPSSARVECFRAIHPLVEKYLPSERKVLSNSAASSEKGKSVVVVVPPPPNTAKNDRLVQLIIKGLLYEYCVEFCQQRATSSGSSSVEPPLDVHFGGLLDGTGFTDADLSLPSWLQSIPPDIFACPFEQRSLNVDIERLEKPSLEASWTEHMLVTPIKPKTFPHSAMPSARPRSAADLMSRSLNPHLDGLAFGLAANQRHLMALSVGDLSSMSKSFASFHLTGKKSMNTSVDRLFEEAGDVFTSSSSCTGELPVTGKSGPFSLTTPPPMPPPRQPRSKSPPERRIAAQPNGVKPAKKEDLWRLPAAGGRSDEKTVERDGGQEKGGGQAVPASAELYKEFQRQKLKAQDSMDGQEKRFGGEALRRPMNGTENVPACGAQPQPMMDNRLSDAAGDGRNLPQSPCSNLIGAGGAVKKPGSVPDSSNRAPNSDFRNTSTPKPAPMYSHGAKVSFSGSQPSPTVVTIKADSSSNQTSAVSPANPDASSWHSTPTVKNNTPQHTSLPPARSSPMVGGPPQLSSLNYQPSSTGSRQSANLSELELAPINWTPSPSDTTKQAPASNAKHGVPGVKTTSYSSNNGDSSSASSANKPSFVPITSLEDVQAIRAAEFHPNGKLYAIGSNSKTLRVCTYPKVGDLRESHQAYQPTVLFKRTKHHKGSIYCLAWNATGDLLATGSNDKSVKLMRFNAETCNVEGDDIELNMHDGTVRDMCFVEDLSNKSSLLISGGAGDCKIYVTDCATGTPFQAMSGHTGHILSLYTWGGAMFVSGAQDRTIRFWDLRTRGCVNLIPSPPSGTGAVKGSPVAAVTVDPSGRMLVSGQEDSSCMLYDIRGNRIIQVFKPHTSDIRTIRFSPRAYYLLTGSYDNKVTLTDLQGDLTLPLPSVVVAQHEDKVIQCRWHPTEFSFLSTSADKTATLWGLPNN